VWIYLLAKDVDKMAAKWPTIYLSRSARRPKIIKAPDYAAYSRKKHALLHQGVPERWAFPKVALSVKNEGSGI
jgi:hypothetical protein